MSDAHLRIPLGVSICSLRLKSLLLSSKVTRYLYSSFSCFLPKNFFLPRLYIIKNHSFLLSLYSFFFILFWNVSIFLYMSYDCIIPLHIPQFGLKLFCVTDNALVWSCLKIHVSLQPEFVFIQTKLKFWPKSFKSDHGGVLSIRCNILERVLLTQRMRSKYYIFKMSRRVLVLL